MGVSRVDYDNEILIDISNDTVTADLLAEGETAHNSNGELIEGTFPIGEVDTQAELIEQIALTLQSKAAPSGGSGSGIIDVTELPTSGIDENAVYRLKEKVQLEKNEVYFRVYLNNQLMTVTLQQFVASLGVPTVANIYAVDDLSNMLETDVQGFSMVNVYIKRSDGIAYVYSPYIPINNGIATVGFVAFTSQGFSGDYDKGFTENADDIDEVGIYTTIEDFKDVVRYFIREGGEWKEITSYYEYAIPHGFTNVETISGDITSIAYSASDILSSEYTEINEEWFRKRDGTYVDSIRQYMFAYNNLETATIPHFIKEIFYDAFYECYELKTITFKGKPNIINYSAFHFCGNLTTINVPWAEGEVENAPWGATNATINYNYTEG